jgi:hypothetical protein
MKRILSIMFFMSFITVINLYSYTLPKEADMIKFLPDKIGDWVADKTFDLAGGEASNDSDNSYKSAVRMYKNGNKSITVSIDALIVTPESQELYEENKNEIQAEEAKCKESTKNTKIQGFNAVVTTSDCPDDGMKENTVIVTFIDDDDFYYGISADSIIFEDAGFGELFGGGELASTDELINFLNMLDLKGIRALVK